MIGTRKVKYGESGMQEYNLIIKTGEKNPLTSRSENPFPPSKQYFHKSSKFASNAENQKLDMNPPQVTGLFDFSSKKAFEEYTLDNVPRLDKHNMLW